MSDHMNEISIPELDLNYSSYKKPAVAPTSPDAKPLPKVTIDGQVIEFMPGDTIMQAAERAGVAANIPRYCYHPGMPIAGTCRMCTVEVEKMPKLMTSCSTPAGDNMVVNTRSDKVMKSRTGVMEFLLTNHPLDCPVCDKAGECELQDYNYEYGPGTSRFKEDKRIFTESTTRKLSEKITLNMNRCVHCERCVRFGEDTTKSYDLVMLNRGWKKELTTPDEKGLTSDYQGCLADICPVGALTWNDFRFQKRAWFLQKTASVCDGCSKGCNIEVHSEKDVIYRFMPIFNEKVNGHWMCDSGRSSWHTAMNPMRIISPMLKVDGKLTSTNWETLAGVARDKIMSASKILVAIGTDATNEEAEYLMQKLPQITKKNITFKFLNGMNGVNTSAEDKKMDHMLIQKDKTPNTKGMEKLGLKALDSTDGHDLVIIFRHGRAAIPTVKNAKVILWGVFDHDEASKVNNAEVLIPGLMTQEKKGSYVNADGIEQHFAAAITHKGFGLNVDKVLGILSK